MQASEYNAMFHRCRLRGQGSSLYCPSLPVEALPHFLTGVGCAVVVPLQIQLSMASTGLRFRFLNEHMPRLRNEELVVQAVVPVIGVAATGGETSCQSVLSSS